MIRPSFIPPRATQELRDFTRLRKQMIGMAAEERNCVQNLLEDANVKIGDVLSDVFGLSGQLMLESLVNGSGGDGSRAHSISRIYTRKKLAQLTAALEGHQMPAALSSIATTHTQTAQKPKIGDFLLDADMRRAMHVFVRLLTRCAPRSHSIGRQVQPIPLWREPPVPAPGDGLAEFI